MSNLSGYDSDVIGFTSVTQVSKSETSSGSQTSQFSESAVGCQTTLSRDCGSMATPEELNSQNDVLHEYPPPGLNEFLRRVVPEVLDQLGHNDRDLYTSDSDEDEGITPKVWQEIKTKEETDGSGDHQLSLLSLSWSSAGNSLAVSLGHMQHENWCEHEGTIKVYTTKRAADDKLVHVLDIHEKNCVSVIQYHPNVAALLAYGTTTGEVVLYNMQNVKTASELQLTSPSGCHGSKRVSALQWADSPLCNTFLVIQINRTGKRRGASDQVLLSSGSDGTINAWQVNANLRIFQNIICYSICGSRDTPAPDITCFDFCRSYPLRPADSKAPEGIFVVGTRSGEIYLCNINADKRVGENMIDPVYEVVSGLGACVLNVAFSVHKPRVFACISTDSELRLYDINKITTPMKVISLESSVSCMCWLPLQPWLVALGTAAGVLLYNLAAEKQLPVAGPAFHGPITAAALTNAGSCRMAVAVADSSIRILEMPTRRVGFAEDELNFP